MWSPGRGGRRGWPIPASSPELAAGEGLGGGLGVAMARFGALGWWGDASGGRRTGSQGVPAAAAGQAGEGDLGRWFMLAGELLGS
jgi:hypothetical protein